MITKLFRNTELKIAYKTKNTLRSQLQTKTMATNTCELNGVYRFKCRECPCIYSGQTGRPFKTRYNEHIREIKNNGENSKFALHIQNTGHRCTNMKEIVYVLHIQHKGRMLNALENFHIYEAHKQGTQLNEALIEPYNPVFEIIIKNWLNSNFSMSHN
jgi:hypothetical protein